MKTAKQPKRFWVYLGGELPQPMPIGTGRAMEIIRQNFEEESISQCLRSAMSEDGLEYKGGILYAR